MFAHFLISKLKFWHTKIIMANKKDVIYNTKITLPSSSNKICSFHCLLSLTSTELEKVYNFTQLAVELNDMEHDVCPTDSRRRPDQRLMEEGRWDEANRTKVLLEEKQRAVRRRREQEAAEAVAQGE